jgi:hypothetical protein
MFEKKAEGRELRAKVGELNTGKMWNKIDQVLFPFLSNTT